MFGLQERDPIERIRKLILGKELATVAELKVQCLLLVLIIKLYLPRCWLLLRLVLLFSSNLFPPLQNIEKEVKKEVEDAVAEAKVI